MAEDFSHLELFEGEHWEVGLHPKQTYLGRSVAVLQRKLENPLECTREERDELWDEILPLYERIVTEEFEPVRINYGHLANEFVQVHWHLIPRYENPNERTFEGVTFVDTNVGRNYAPHPDVLEAITDELLQEIRSALKSHLPE